MMNLFSISNGGMLKARSGENATLQQSTSLHRKLPLSKWHLYNYKGKTRWRNRENVAMDASLHHNHVKNYLRSSSV